MCEVASKGRTDFTSADPNTYTLVWKQEGPQHHFGVPKTYFSFGKNTPALHTNTEHREEERFPLVDTVSYRQPGWILWWSRRCLQLLGDPSFSRLYPSHTILSCPRKNCFSPGPGKYFPPLRTFFSTAIAYLQHPFSLKLPHPPLLFTPQKKNRERGVSHLAKHSCYFSLKDDCPSQLMVITSSVGNGPRERRTPPPWGKDYTYLSDTQFSSQQVRVHIPKNSGSCCHQKMFVSHRKLSSGSCRSVVGRGPNDKASVIHAHEAEQCRYLPGIYSSISRKRVATSPCPSGCRKSGLSRKGCLPGSSACGDPRVQGNDLENNLVFWLSEGSTGAVRPLCHVVLSRCRCCSRPDGISCMWLCLHGARKVERKHTDCGSSRFCLQNLSMQAPGFVWHSPAHQCRNRNAPGFG